MKRLLSQWTDLSKISKIGFALAIFGFSLIICFSLNPAFNNWSLKINPGLANNFGGFIGGLVGPIFSLAGFFLLYETITAQKGSVEKQQHAFQIQQFETKYFEMLKFHRDNVSQMAHRIPWSPEKYFYRGTGVFVEIRAQYSKILRVVNDRRRKQDMLTDREVINIAYLILFFGVSKSARTSLYEALNEYNCYYPFSEAIIKELYDKKTKYSEGTVYNGGHKVRLGHYFRHLFQTVKYVDSQPFLDREQKRQYVKMLRAQMSDYEHEIFFLNALSIGYEWKDNGYIDNYELTKNLPKRIWGIDPDIYFPNGRGLPD